MLSAFIRELRSMSVSDIRREATHLDAPQDELSWWRSHLAVESRIREAHLAVRAAAAARAARDAVFAAARGHADVIDADTMDAVARAAGEAARGLVAGCHLAGSGLLALDYEPMARFGHPALPIRPTAA